MTDKTPESSTQGSLSLVLSNAKWEWFGSAVLVSAVLWMLRISWRKWPDPLVDFGRELYLPWRLSEGAVLYRDIDANYGPLSQYFNALVFHISGPGLMHLVFVNLIIYAAILTLIYWEVRIGWGRLAAFACSLFFVIIFSFSQFVGVGNYNFATPYAHETTHGFLLILILLFIWTSWLRSSNGIKIFAAGLICGLCVLLKVETIFTASIVTFGAFARALITHESSRSWRFWRWQAPLFLTGGLMPSLIATAALWKTGAFSLVDAFCWANSGWMGLFLYKNIAQDPIQAAFLGTANLAENLQALLIYGGLSVAVIVAAALLCKSLSRDSLISPTLVGFAVVTVLAAWKLPWIELGKVFPAWLILAAVLPFLRSYSSSEPVSTPSANMRWLMLLAAIALLTRMALNPRIFHYGYCQASLAGIVALATAFTLPRTLNLPSGNRVVYLSLLSLFVSLGFWNLEQTSQRLLSLKVQPIGENADRFYGFHPQVDPTSTILEETRTFLAAEPGFHTLLVVPEGIILNYLLRKPTTVSVYMFFPYWLNWREKIVRDLEARPPDYAVIITRDLREYGVKKFGETPEHGRTVLSWIDWHYRPVKQIGGDPLDITQAGATVLKKIP